MRRALSVLMSLVMLIGIANLMKGNVDAAESTGKCGENATYSYNRSTEELTISGYGDMYDYDDESNPSPFEDLDSIDTVTIEPGITSIGNYAFFQRWDIKAAIIPDTVTKIGQNSFDNCEKITQISPLSNVISIGDNAFFNCNGLSSISLGKALQKIGSYAFYHCTFADVYYSGSETEWNSVSIDDSNDVIYDASIHFNHSHNYVVESSLEPTCTSEGYSTYVCDICKCLGEKKYVSALGHNYNDVVIAPTCTNNGYTTHTCTRCGYSYSDTEKAELGHDYDYAHGVVTAPTCTSKGYTTYTCTRCSSIITGNEKDMLSHTYVEVITEPDCINGGYTTHTCSSCGHSYIDSETPPAGHHYEKTTIKGTLTTDGKIVSECTGCHDVQSTTILPKASKIKINTSSFTYNGGVKKPVLTIEDSQGNALATKNRQITWSNSSSKKIGTYKVTITLTGNYEGIKTFTYKINPKGTKLTKVTSPKSKQIKVTWSKQTTQTTGYQIQYSLKNDFSKPTTVTVSKNKTTSTTIKKLKSKKKYYVRIRTYKTVSGKKYYSSWSSSKSIKTK